MKRVRSASPLKLCAVPPVTHRVPVHPDCARGLGQAAHAQLQQTGFELVRIVRQLVAASLLVVGQCQPMERGRRRQGAAVSGEGAAGKTGYDLAAAEV